jgi:uncharacterized protein (DUF736 family)
MCERLFARRTFAAKDDRALTPGIEIGAGWAKAIESSGKKHVNLSTAAPMFGHKKLYANLGRAAGQEDENLGVEIWDLRH